MAASAPATADNSAAGSADSTTESFSAVTRARTKSHTNPNMRCVKILYKYDFSESNPHRITFEHHQVFFGSYSFA